MDYVVGWSLPEILARCRARRRVLPLSVALEIADGALAALEFAHGLTDELGAPQPLVHGDLTPSKILINRTGDVKVGNFGVANAKRLLPRPRIRPFGVSIYAAPEQRRGGPASTCGDLYAVGLILSEMLPSKRPAGYAALLRRALHPRPEGRYPDAKTFRTAVAAVASLQRRTGPSLTAWLASDDGPRMPAPEATPWPGTERPHQAPEDNVRTVRVSSETVERATLLALEEDITYRQLSTTRFFTSKWIDSLGPGPASGRASRPPAAAAADHRWRAPRSSANEAAQRRALRRRRWTDRGIWAATAVLSAVAAVLAFAVVSRIAGA